MFRLRLFLIIFLFFLSPIASAEEPGVEAWVDAAMRNSMPLKIVIKKMKLSDGKVWQARRNLFPELVFSYEDRAGEIGGLEYDGVSYKGKLSKTVFDAGRSVYALSRENTELEKTRMEYERLKREIVFKVSQVYWRLAQARLSGKSFEEIFKNIEALTARAEKLYQEELITLREYLEIRSLFLKTLVKRNTLERDEKLALLEFRHIVNIEEGEEIEVAKEIPFKAIEVELFRLWELAQKNRPERQIIEMDKETKRLNLLIAEREKWPEVGMSFSYGTSAEDYKFNRLDLDDEWQVLAKVTLNFGGSSVNYNYDREDFTPVVGSFRGEEIAAHTVQFSLLDRLDKDNKVREEEIRLDEAGEEKGIEEKRIRREVEEAYYNLSKARINVEAASMELSFREKDAEILDLNTGLGRSNVAELIRAKISFGEAKISYFEALAEHAMAIAEVEHAVGGLP